MPLKIPNEVRASVIGDWLSGKPRDTIARDNVVSAGAVSNTVNNWRGATAYDADALRELGIMFRKLGIAAPQSALGVDEENFGDFVSQIYSQCKDIGFKTQQISTNFRIPMQLPKLIPHYGSVGKIVTNAFLLPGIQLILMTDIRISIQVYTDTYKI